MNYMGFITTGPVSDVVSGHTRCGDLVLPPC